MCRLVRLGFACVLVASAATSARAQSREIATVRAGEDPRPVAALLSRQARFAVQDAPLAAALTDLSKHSRVGVAFSPSLLPDDRIVSCACETVTVGEALDRMLAGSGFSYVVHDDQVLIIPRPQPSLWRSTINYGLLANGGSSSAQSAGSRAVRILAERVLPQVGTIVGTVTEAGDGKAIVNAQVAVDGAGRAFTDAEGRYRIANVPTGRRSVSITSIGYRRATREVAIRDGVTTTVDFALELSPSQLDAVVVTVTGEQRVRELGHVVGRINADSVVREAPVSSVSELLNGRIAGVRVQTPSGLVGGDASLRIRTPNSIQLGADPIVIVDGMRYTSVLGDPITLSSVSAAERSTPLNDLNPNEILSIEVVKGPSAATLYGTDAANGVIVITTKRGVPGAPRWKAYIKGATTEIPTITFPDQYWGWRSTANVPSMTSSCTLDLVASGSCTQDSVTVARNPLSDPSQSIFDSKPRWDFGANVSGGSEAFRYFVAGDFERATGPLRLPSAVVDSLEGARGRLPKYMLEPNALSKVNLRSKATIVLGASAGLDVTAGYIVRANRTFGINFFNPYARALEEGSPLEPYGRGGVAEFLSVESTERVERFLGSIAGRWSASEWLSVRGLFGLDAAQTTRSSVSRRGEAPTIGFATGAVADDRGRQIATTAELAATARFAVAAVTSRTSLGAQYIRTLDDLLAAAGTNLPPGGTSIGQAANVQSRQGYREQVTLGTYVEHVVGLRERLYLIGALRADGASTFGRDYNAVIYPKASVSWLVSEEPFMTGVPVVDELRLRYAFGRSGQQPRPEWARPGYEVRQVHVGGTITNSYAVTTLGNPTLRPERTSEHEAGFDASVLGRRADVRLTWFRRRTIDQILGIQLPPGLFVTQTNLGQTTGRGLEAEFDVRLVDLLGVRWDAQLKYSSQETTLDRLGDAPERAWEIGGYREGYAIGARFQRRFTYADLNSNGIIEPSEIEFADSATYAGESAPPRTMTLGNSVGLFGNRVRISALLERRSGFTQLNSLARGQCGNGRCRGLVDPEAPLEEQAMAVAARHFGYQWLEKGDFTRLREISIAVDVPGGIARTIRARTATISLQARNVALWTSYSGADPESAPASGAVQELGIPQGRSAAIRLDVGF